MQFDFIGLNRELSTTVILGAGASRGAKLYPQSLADRPAIPPPLDGDFFRLLQRMRTRTRSVQALLRFVRREYGPELSVTMERFYTEAEAADRFHEETATRPGPRLREFRNALRWFHEVLPAVFAESLGERSCEYHEHLAKSLSTSDTVISYNYDCLIDTALASSAGNKWRADRGYGFSIDVGHELWQNHGRGRKAEKGIQLLKPHGSLNWNVSGSHVSLDDDYYWVADSSGRIVPPTHNKDIWQRPFVDVWKAARAALSRSQALVVIGYSMPEQDLMSHILVRTEARATGGLKALVVVDPLMAVRARVIDVMKSAITPETVIGQFTTMGGFSLNLVDDGHQISEWEPPI